MSGLYICMLTDTVRKNSDIITDNVPFKIRLFNTIVNIFITFVIAWWGKDLSKAVDYVFINLTKFTE